MKYFITILSAMLLLAGCGEDEDVEIDGNLIQERGGVAYLPKEEDPFTGVAVFKYESGQKEEEVTYKEGKEEGQPASKRCRSVAEEENGAPCVCRRPLTKTKQRSAAILGSYGRQTDDRTGQAFFFVSSGAGGAPR